MKLEVQILWQAARCEPIEVSSEGFAAGAPRVRHIEKFNNFRLFQEWLCISIKLEIFKERAQALFWSKMAALIARPICTWDVRGFAAVSVSESCVERFLIHLLQLRPFSAELSFCSCKSLE